MECFSSQTELFENKRKRVSLIQQSDVAKAFAGATRNQNAELIEKAIDFPLSALPSVASAVCRA
jgi:hypothetical protein